MEESYGIFTESGSDNLLCNVVEPIRRNKYVKAIFESPTRNMVKMNKILEEQEKRYDINSNTWFSGHSFTKIWEMQRYVYDYYFFFKKNYLPLDHFTDPQNYLIYYHWESLSCLVEEVKESE